MAEFVADMSDDDKKKFLSQNFKTEIAENSWYAIAISKNIYDVVEYPFYYGFTFNQNDMNISEYFDEFIEDQNEFDGSNDESISKTQQDYDKLQQDYDQLQQKYDKLQQDYDRLQQTYDKLQKVCDN